MPRRWLVVAVLATVACLVAGWLAARAFESPAQQQARARPPAPKPIVAPVVVGMLADEITARARIAPALADHVKPAAVPDRAVVTAHPTARGALVGAGQPLLMVNGRPLFVLPGKFRFYRDIVDGMSGPDVVQLQDGLIAAGFLAAGVERGTYGPATQAAVSTLYQAAGAEPITRPALQPQTGQGTAKHAGRPPPPVELPIVPLGEVAVTPHLPATLASSLPVGADVRVDRPVATLTTGAMVAHAGVAASVVARIRPGMRAQLVGGRGAAIRAQVLMVHAADASAAGDLRDVILRPVNASMPSAWRGTTVLARIITTLVRRRALIVPTRAVAQGAEGHGYVLKQIEGERFARVPVQPLGSLAGRTAVAPLTAHGLQASDHVRVG